MHSERYVEARKEFTNCLIMSPICLFVSLVNAFTEWQPIMREELKNEKASK